MNEITIQLSAVDAADLFDTALAATPDGVAVHRIRRDVTGQITGFSLERINRAGAAPFTDDPDDLVGMDLATLLGPSSAPMLAAFERAARTGRLQRFRTTFSDTAAAGTTDSVVVRLDEHRLLSTWRDITGELVHEALMQEALRRAEEDRSLLAATVDALDDAVVILDRRPRDVADRPDTASSVIRFANATAAAALGMDADRLRGLDLRQVIGPRRGGELEEVITRSLTAGQPHRHEIVIRTDAGRVLDARQICAHPLTDTRVVLVSHDSTRAEWELEEARAESG